MQRSDQPALVRFLDLGNKRAGSFGPYVGPRDATLTQFLPLISDPTALATPRMAGKRNTDHLFALPRAFVRVALTVTFSLACPPCFWSKIFLTRPSPSSHSTSVQGAPTSQG